MVLEVTISSGLAIAITRAAMCTAMPRTSPPVCSISPMCSPARMCNAIPCSSSLKAAAQRIARPGLSKVTKIPSPVVLTSCPLNSSTSREANSWCTSSSSRQRRSPSRFTRSVESTMSVNSTVANTALAQRSGGRQSGTPRYGRGRTPVSPR